MAKSSRGGKRASLSTGKTGTTIATQGQPQTMWPGDKIDDYWYGGLNAYRRSNKYITMNRVSSDENRIVVKVGEDHLITTQYGYGLILDDSHVVFLKTQNVSKNWYGNEVILNKQYFNVKKWGDFSDRFISEPKNLNFSEWVNVAKEQAKAGNEVMWESHYHSPKQKAIAKNVLKKQLKSWGM